MLVGQGDSLAIKVAKRPLVGCGKHSHLKCPRWQAVDQCLQLSISQTHAMLGQASALSDCVAHGAPIGMRARTCAAPGGADLLVPTAQCHIGQESDFSRRLTIMRPPLRRSACCPSIILAAARRPPRVRGQTRQKRVKPAQKKDYIDIWLGAWCASTNEQGRADPSYIPARTRLGSEVVLVHAT